MERIQQEAKGVAQYWTRFLSRVEARTGIKDQCHDHYFEPFKTAIESLLETWIEKDGALEMLSK